MTSEVLHCSIFVMLPKGSHTAANRLMEGLYEDTVKDVFVVHTVATERHIPQYFVVLN